MTQKKRNHGMPTKEEKRRMYLAGTTSLPLGFVLPKGYTAEKKIGRRKYKAPQQVIYRTRKGEFSGTLLGFKENSALIEPAEELETRRLVSTRNIYDPATKEPFKKTTKQEIATKSGAQLTAYIPTREERKKWDLNDRVTLTPPRKMQQ